MAANRSNGCLIWPGHEGVVRRTGFDYVVETSPRAGGKYVISDIARIHIEGDQFSNSHRARLTTRLIDLRQQGVEWPVVTKELIIEAKNARALPIHQRADRLLHYLVESVDSVASSIRVTIESHEAYAWSESLSWEEIDYFLKYLSQMGWLEGQSSGNVYRGQVTVNGHNRIAEQKTIVDSSQAFVAMWFDDSMAEDQQKGIEAGIRDAGFTPLAINRKEHVNKIEDEVIAEIRRSRFLVADFTHGDDGVRGSVYYEAGFAHGLDIDVIFTCREGATLHFDTSHYNHIVWNDFTDLREKLKNRILAVIDRPRP